MWHLGSEADRRSNLRFPLALDARFVERRTPVAGTGQTVNLSSSGALITSQHRIRVGVLVELFVDWPIRLDGTTPLQFVAIGRVVRSAPGAFALALQRHEFRTAKKRPQSAFGDEGQLSYKHP